MINNFFDRYIKRYVAAVFILGASAIVLINSAEASDAVQHGIELSLQRVIPSLFPLIFLSQLFIKSGSARELGKLLSRPTERFFGLPGVCGAALIISAIGGFPAGARAAETLVDSHVLTKRQGKRLASFAFCSGPGFGIGLVGAVLYGNKTVGLMILTAQVISSIMIGITLNIICGKDLHNHAQEPAHNDECSLSAAFVESASDAAATVLAMSSFIVVFCVISAMLELSGINQLLGGLLSKIGLGELGGIIMPCLLEVTSGSELSVACGLPLTAFTVGFGGLCVHFQNFAICRGVELDKGLYIMLRLLQGILCTIIVNLALSLPCFRDIALQTLAPINDSRAEFSPISMSFGMIMLVMCMMSVLCLPNGRQKYMIKKGARAKG